MMAVRYNLVIHKYRFAYIVVVTVSVRGRTYSILRVTVISVGTHTRLCCSVQSPTVLHVVKLSATDSAAADRIEKKTNPSENIFLVLYGSTMRMVHLKSTKGRAPVFLGSFVSFFVSLELSYGAAAHSTAEYGSSVLVLLLRGLLR